jgi:hypothetical protein
MVDWLEFEMQSYLTMHQIRAAAHFAELACGLEQQKPDGQESWDHHRAYVIGAVSCAVGFLEPAVNELFADSAEIPDNLAPLDSAAVQMMAKVWTTGLLSRPRRSTLEKFDIALSLAGKPGMDKGRPPYQDVVGLVPLPR